MPDKDPSNFTFITYAWVIIVSMWGGLVSFNQKIKSGHARPFNVMELLGELATSGFVGMLTFWLCSAAGIQPLVTAAFVGITGHMGSRALWRMEKWAEQRLMGNVYCENEDKEK